ncbi:hypothetical protein E2562_012269 [Oryza meyeriana var. granulata]|uniref:Uncharacterized protein n=1 Tax=Oryza meyeriana var. granulata TaxID=110450 RepID=A0A6G1DH80_9ORYZ|nr:hypothetical protein E2562_012269 [Oryza meyeriana var. granulata]
MSVEQRSSIGGEGGSAFGDGRQSTGKEKRLDGRTVARRRMWMGGADSAADVEGRRAARRSRGFCGGGLGLGDEVASRICALRWAQPRREREEGDSA